MHTNVSENHMLRYVMLLLYYIISYIISYIIYHIVYHISCHIVYHIPYRISYRSSCKVPFILVRFYQNLYFFQKIFKNTQHKIS